MKTFPRLSFVLLVRSVLFGALVFGGFRGDAIEKAVEPVYHGHPLRYWFDILDGRSYESFDAIRFTGAVPYYSSLRLLPPVPDVEEISGGPEARKALKSAGADAIPFLLQWMNPQDERVPFYGVEQSFRILGASARAAIPELAGMATNRVGGFFAEHGVRLKPGVANTMPLPRLKHSATTALLALGYIGPDARPALFSILTNAASDEQIKDHAMAAIDRTYSHPPEPVYHKRPLSYWVDILDLRYDKAYNAALSAAILSSSWKTPVPPEPTVENIPQGPEAQDAIRNAGQDAVPYLLMRLSQRCVRDVPVRGIREAFRVLGPVARTAIPELTRMATNVVDSPKSSASFPSLPLPRIDPRTVAAFEALGGIGMDALPTLISFLTNDVPTMTKIGALEGISDLGTNAASALPVVVKCSEDKDVWVAQAAVKAQRVMGGRKD